MTEQLTLRDVDAWVAENLFDWTRCDPTAKCGGITGFGFRPGHDPKVHAGKPFPFYTTDANADALVREAVRMSQNRAWCELICESHKALAVYRCPDCWSERGCDAAYNETGDWAVAAYAASHNRDPIEVWKELNQ